MKNVLRAAVMVGAVLIPSIAGAASLTINSTDGLWTAIDGVAAAGLGADRLINNVPDPRVARWGIDNSDPQNPILGSAYLYSPQTGPFLADVNTAFLFGGFSHLNFEIAPGSGPSSITMDFSMNIEGGSSPDNVINSVLTFTHVETPNSSDPCPYGGANGQGVNVSGCADSVTLSSLFNAPITIDGQNYFFSLLGFSQNGGATIDNQLLTQENAGVPNLAGMYAIVTDAPLNPVPEPGSMLLLGTGLLGVVVGKVRRSRQ